MRSRSRWRSPPRLSPVSRRRSRPRSTPRRQVRRAAEQKQRVDQPLNNQPVWKEIRSGEPQITTVRGRETNVLIQPEGQTWRAVRVPLSAFGGYLFVFALVVLGAFYLWRGPIEVHGKPTGRLIERFTVVQRVVHWTVAIAFTALAVTGLILTFGKTVLLPLIGYTLFSWLATLVEDPPQLRRTGARRDAADTDRAVRPLERLQRARLVVDEETRRHAVRRARSRRQGERRPEVSLLDDGRAARTHAVRHRPRSRFPEFRPDPGRRCSGRTAST